MAVGVYSPDKLPEGSTVRVKINDFTLARHIAGLEMVVAARPANLSERSVLELRMPGAKRSDQSEYVRANEVEEISA